MRVGSDNGGIRGESLVSTEANHLSTSIEDEEVILDIKTGTYYGLNAVGRHIWLQLQEDPVTADRLVESVAEAFAVDRNRGESDVRDHLATLRAEGLIEVTDEA